MSGRLICYVDETSFNGWVRKPKAWFVSTKKFAVPLSKKRGHGQTLIGAIFSHSTRFIKHIGRSTSIADFKAFLEKLVAVLPVREQNERKPMILLDSKSVHNNWSVLDASAHKNREIKEIMERHFQVEFIPRYSCRVSVSDFTYFYSSTISKVCGVLSKETTTTESLTLL